jgi:hypothetical protein
MTNVELIETICQGLVNMHEIWAVPVELGIALWLLERQLDLAFLAPTAVSIFAVCFSGSQFPLSDNRVVGIHLPLQASLILWCADGRHWDYGKVYGKCSEGLDRRYPDASGCYCVYAVLYEGNGTFV